MKNECPKHQYASDLYRCPYCAEDQSNSSSMACSIADSELVERAVRNARNHNPCPTMPRWHAVKKVFACGSTEAGNLCRRFGLDPDEELPTMWERQ